MRFLMIADEETVSAFSRAILGSFEGAVVDTKTTTETVDDRSVMLREIHVKYHVE